MLRLGEKIPYRSSTPLTLSMNDNNGIAIGYYGFENDISKYLYINEKHLVYKDSTIHALLSRIDSNKFRIDLNLFLLLRERSTPDKEYISVPNPFNNSQVDASLFVYIDLSNNLLIPNEKELNSVGLKRIVIKPSGIYGFGSIGFGFRDYDLDHINLQMEHSKSISKLMFMNDTRELLNKPSEDNYLRYMKINGFAIFEVEDASLLPEKKLKVNFNIFSQKPSLFSYKGGVNLC